MSSNIHVGGVHDEGSPLMSQHGEIPNWFQESPRQCCSFRPGYIFELGSWNGEKYIQMIVNHY